MRFKTQQTIVIGLVFFSFFVSALVSRTVFERLPHLEDELAYIYQAKIFAHGDVVIDIPEPRRAFWQPFVVDYVESGNRFGKYSPGWPLLLSIGVNLGQMWVVNAFFASLTVALAYRLGREIFDEEVGMAAAALTAFSPMALLLNATLMSHTSALFLFTLFMYAFWRIEKRKNTTRWGIIAGLSLGLLVLSRPLTAIGVTFPFIVWSVFKVIRAIYLEIQSRQPETKLPRDQYLVPVLRPLMILGVLTVILSLGLPFFQNAATGDPGQDLYTLVWEYDRPGFGTCCGRSSQDDGEGHTIIKGIRHSRFDLSLTAADLFGWQIGTIDAELQEHLRTSSGYWPLLGLSFFLLPFGLLIGFRESWSRLWIIIGMIWLLAPFARNMAFLNENADQIWLWLGIAALWFLIPALWYTVIRPDASKKSQWTWLLLGVIVGLIGVQLAYWIGSQRYSTRYYYETLTAFAILSALPIAWFLKNVDSRVSYPLFAGVLLWSLYTYSTPRIEALRDFNKVSSDVIDQIKERKQTDDPTLVLVTGAISDVRWRSFGTLMAITGPYLNDDIVAAWDYSPDNDEVRQEILARFPGREVIEMKASGNDYWFEDPNCVPGPGLAGIQDCIQGPPINSTTPPTTTDTESPPVERTGPPVESSGPPLEQQATPPATNGS